MEYKLNQSRVGEIFRAFLVLGLTSFGGPVAHLGYFRNEFVSRRKWLDEQNYADLVALCQFLPGPASSQVGFAVGLQRGGLAGALTAWAAFTLPSALILLAFAYSAAAFEGAFGLGLLHGLKLVAVAIVAQAVWGMARNLCPDRTRASIAVGAVILVLLLPSTAAQVGAIAAGMAMGLLLCKDQQSAAARGVRCPVSKGISLGALVVFCSLLAGLPLLLLVLESQAVALFDAFYRAGALVFGGGHVVLPLLETSVVDSAWLSEDEFLAGYGAAQAIPGPLFTFAAYLGAAVNIELNGVAGAAIALSAIFLPGMLLLLGVLPYWDALRSKAKARAAMAGANAAVVGILGAALYDPVWTSTVVSGQDFAIALTAFVLLTVWQVAPWKVVLGTALAGALVALAV